MSIIDLTSLTSSSSEDESLSLSTENRFKSASRETKVKVESNKVVSKTKCNPKLHRKSSHSGMTNLTSVTVKTEPKYETTYKKSVLSQKV